MAITSVQANINGTLTNLTKNSTSGKWEATVTAPGVTSFHQVGGYYNVTIEARNDAGTTSTATAAELSSLCLVVRETVKPTVAITSPGAAAFVTNAQQPILFQLRDETGGSGVDLATLQLRIDGGAALGEGAAGMVLAATAGGFDGIYTPQMALADGAHTVTLAVSDNDGNTAAVLSRSYTVDTVPPVLNVTQPANGFVTNSASMTLQGNTNDTTSSPVTLTLRLNGTDLGALAVATGGGFAKEITLLEGENVLIVTATDQAGKVSAATLRGVLDTSVPRIERVTIGPNPADTGATLLIAAVVS